MSLKKKLAFTNAGLYAAEYLRNFQIAKHHVEWADLVNKHKFLNIEAARGHGKTLCGNEEIMDPITGKLIKVKDWPGGPIFGYDIEKGEISAEASTKSVADAKYDCLRVTLLSGRQFECTKMHPVRVFGRWLKAEELSIGTRIACVRKCSTPIEAEHVPEAFIWGATLSNQKIHKDTLEEINRIMRQHSNQAGVSDLEQTGASSTASGPGQTRHAPLQAGPWLILDIPERMFRADERSLWAFFRGILSGATCIKTRQMSAYFRCGRGSRDSFVGETLEVDAHVQGETSSYTIHARANTLLHNLQHLASRIGLVTSTYNNDGRWVVTGRNLLAILQSGPIFGRYAYDCQEAADSMADLYTGIQNDVSSFSSSADAPPDACARDSASRLALTFASQPTPRASSAFGSSSAPLRVFTQSYADLEKFPKEAIPYLKRPPDHYNDMLFTEDLLLSEPVAWSIWTSDIYYDAVDRVDEIGPQTVYPIETPKTHTFIANDAVHHNSEFFSKLIPIWEADRGVEKIAIFGANKTQAVEKLLGIKQEIETNQKLAHLLPKDMGDARWSATDIQLANGTLIQARGAGSATRGMHPDIIIIDDLQTDEASTSRDYREKLERYFFGTIMPMLNPGGRLVNIGTPLSEADILQTLKRNPLFHSDTFPAVDENGEFLWPERFGPEQLDIWKASGSLLFAREYLCKVTSDDSSLFPLKLFEPLWTAEAVLGMGLSAWHQLGITRCVIGVDFAIGGQKDSDYTVVWVEGIDQFENRWVMDIQKARITGLQDQLDMIRRAASKYRPDIIVCEAVLFSRIFGDELIRLTDLPIVQHRTGVDKHSLEKGIPSMRIALENHKYRLPCGDDASRQKIEDWIGEMTGFVLKEGKVISTSRHDDCAMASYMCSKGTSMGSFNFSFDEGDVDGVLTLKSGGEDDGFRDRYTGVGELVSDTGSEKVWKWKP